MHWWIHELPGTWLHDVAQSALAAAVLMLGLVILLELRSVMRLRHAVDRSLARVFEQLDLLRFENQQLLEAHGQGEAPAAQREPREPHRMLIETTEAALNRAPLPASAVPAPAGMAGPTQSEAPGAKGRARVGNIYESAATLAASGVPAGEIAERCGLATGEARLLSSLARARAQLTREAPARERPGTADIHKS